MNLEYIPQLLFCKNKESTNSIQICVQQTQKIMRAKNAENLTEGIVVSKMDGLFEPRKYNNERYVNRVSGDRVLGENHIPYSPEF